MTSRFTEQETQRYYDAEDAIYRSLWDSAGSVHWGLFDQSTGNDFLKACSNLNDVMAQRALIDSSSRVLDIGCGNGNTAFWMSDRFRCNVTGADLSGVRVGNAVKSLENQPAEIRGACQLQTGIGHGASVRRRSFHPRLEPGHLLPCPRQTGGPEGSV